jgi:maltose O-acetyltransferase
VVNFACLFDGRKYHILAGDDVYIGTEATILTLSHDSQSSDFIGKGADVIIKDRVWIGYRAVILPGVTIGEEAVVGAGAGAVVTKDEAPFTIVAGSLAKEIDKRNPNLTYKLNHSAFLL